MSPVRPSTDYDPELVEQVVLTEVVELLPARLTISELSLWIATDPEDPSEVESIGHAVRELKRSGLLRHRSDERVVEPTYAALRAVGLLVG